MLHKGGSRSNPQIVVNSLLVGRGHVEVELVCSDGGLIAVAEELFM